MSDVIDYEYLIDSAMRVLVRAVLSSVESKGELPRGHYFHISFVTKYDGVQIPMHLLEKYPREMTIALQNQFSDLKIQGDSFSVKLAFGGQEEKLVIPFCAITSFSDPSENFVLRMSPDNTGMVGKSKFHEMINHCVQKTSDNNIKTEDNVINFADIKKLLY